MRVQFPGRAASTLVLLVTWAILACGNSPAPVTAPAGAPHPPEAPPAPEPPDGPVPSLRTGTQSPVEHADPLAAHVQRRAVEGGLETLLVVIDVGKEQSEAFGSQGQTLTVAIGGQPWPFTFANASSDRSTHKPTLEIWARRPASAAGSLLEGDLFVPSSQRGSYGSPGEHYRFRADDPAPKLNDAALLGDWERALEARLGGGGWQPRSGPWQSFARAKLAEIAPVPAPPIKPHAPHGAAARPTVILRPTPPVHRTFDGLSGLMETTTGAIAIQEALQNDRTLFLTAAREPPSLPLSTVKGPALARHPWGEMLRRLGTKAPAEPLAAAAPAEFYYARAASLPVLFRLLDQVDQWGTPASRALDGAAEDRGVAARYEAELGVGRGPLTRALGPSVIADLAVVGSDPYVKEGSDVTIVFRVKDRALFDAGLAMAMGEHERVHGSIGTKKATMAGATVTISRSTDGAVRQHRATVGDLELVSNSPAAITRVLETLAGRHPRLSDEPDFHYMLARDAGTRADVLAYMGDRFVAEVAGPRQKILEARRQIALAELMTPGFAALLYGTMNGKSPGKLADLVKAHLLSPADLSHATGGAIAWKPGEAAVSAWGTPAALTPLIDLPQPDTITDSERAGYERFAQGYQSDWAAYIDPIAIRIALEPAGPATRLTMDLRELPLLDRTRYREIDNFVGSARFEASSIDGGARAVFGIGEDSEVRRLTHQLRSLSRRHDLTFDWIGEWGMVGMLDRAQVAVATKALAADDLPQAPPPPDEKRPSHRHDDVQEIAKLPLYAAIAVKNPLGAALALTGLRAMAEESTPGLLDWGESGKHKGVSIVRVGINGKRAHEEFGQDVDTQVFYAVTQGAILVSMNDATLRKLIDDRIDGKGPRAPADAAGGEQASFELASDKGKGLWTAIMWMFEAEVLKNDSGASRSNAEALLYGAPERAGDPAAMRALARAYFGSVPLGVDGGELTLAKEGVVDPVRGSAYAPVWPALPVPGSPVDVLMTAIAHARGDLSFDDEGTIGKDPPMRSLHARVWAIVREPSAGP